MEGVVAIREVFSLYLLTKGRQIFFKWFSLAHLLMIRFNHWKHAVISLLLKCKANESGGTACDSAPCPTLKLVSHSTDQTDLVQMDMSINTTWGHIGTLGVNCALSSKDSGEGTNAYDLSIPNSNIRCWRIDQFTRRYLR